MNGLRRPDRPATAESSREGNRHEAILPRSFTRVPPRAPLFLLAIILLLPLTALPGCERAPDPPHALPAVDTLARRFLTTIASRNLDAIRAPLTPRGREEVTSLSMARTFGFFEGGPPEAVTLLDAEIADSRSPTPAERHRLTYRLDFPGDRHCYYFFELMIENGDSAVSGFRIEPRQDVAR